MAIEFTKEQEDFIQQLATGRFASERDVIAEALDALARESNRSTDMNSFRQALDASRSHNSELSAEEADQLAREAAQWVKQTSP